MNEENAIIRAEFLSPAISVQDALNVYQAKKQFIEGVLRENVDFGTIPGTGTKPVLLKPGAEKMTSFFGLSTVFVDVEKVEDWIGTDHGGEPFFYYREKCELYRGERLIASADGSCNSFEKKYRYRNADRLCPACGKPTIIKGKEEYGGGWICFTKKGGCGTKFSNADPSITDQSLGQVKNPDVAELVNTILKMAQKRALVAATLIATGVSDYFTQDIEDYVAPGQFVDAQVKDVTPPAPVEKKSNPVKAPEDQTLDEERPYEPAVFKSRFNTLVSALHGKYKDLKVTDAERKVLASAIEGVFDGDKLKRYEFTKWLTGTASTKDLNPYHVKALMTVMEVKSFDDAPNDFSISEIRSAHTEALREMGQEEFPFGEAPAPSE